MAITTTGISAPTDIFAKETPKPVEGAGGNAFGQDTFLKLLVSQLRFQDPSEPVDNQQFLGQMAEFTGLEQMAKLNTSLEKLTGSSVKTDAVAMLGAEVTIKPTGQLLNDETPNEVVGVVSEIRFLENDVKIKVNGVEYSIEDVTKVRAPGVEALLGQ